MPPGETARYQESCSGCRCIAGGATRQQSVELLLEMSERELVLIADIARPFASLALYSAVLEAARGAGAAGAFLQPDVPVARIVDNCVTQILQSDQAGIFQSPQAFSRTLLVDLIARAHVESWQEQSTLQLALLAGINVGVVPGEKINIKLTSPEDWQIAQQLTEFLQ